MSGSRIVSRIATVLVGALVCAVALARNHSDFAVTTDAAKVKHVFVIVLENKNYADTFGTSTQDPYLQTTLVPMGALLTQYYGTGHVSLDNYISMMSGQGATPDTDDDCIPGLVNAVNGAGNYNDVEVTALAPQGQVVAKGGCVYPRYIRTLADQMELRGLSWKGYMEDMGNDPARESDTCGHPALGVGTDHTNSAEAPSAAVPLGDAYATRHNPFVYFHSIIDSPTCKTHVVNLNVLTQDLASARTTPNLVFITPNLCNDGHDGDGTGATGKGCANGQPGGLTSADAFLKVWVPKIMASEAYKKDGLLVITFDESTNATQTVSSDPNTHVTTVDVTFSGQTCCDQQPGPNLAGVRPSSVSLPTGSPYLIENLVFNGFGGDRIGAVLLSPFVKPGSTSDTPYNHYSLLRSFEDIFGIWEHLGFAADDLRKGYVLDTIGNDQDVFEHPYEYHDPIHWQGPRF